MYNYNTKEIEEPSLQTMRAGWTMIELILIIIIVGILASIALGRLSTTRDDAKLSADVSNMNICIRNVGAKYAATRVFDLNGTACSKVRCYTIEVIGSIMNVEINETAEASLQFCSDVENVGGHLVNRYQFAGSTVKR